MNVVTPASALRRECATATEQNSDAPLDAAWIVLEAANDLGDYDAVDACRRVIDASLNGQPALPSDLNVVVHYFR